MIDAHTSRSLLAALILILPALDVQASEIAADGLDIQETAGEAEQLAVDPVPRHRMAPKATTPTATTPQPSSPQTPLSRTPPPSIHVTTHRPAAAPFATIQQALLRGDMATARTVYEKLLATQTNNADALAGLALLHLRQGSPNTARSLLDKAVALAPANSFAQSLLTLLNAPADLTGAESRLRRLIAEHPDTGPLAFALGNVYARQARWSEAQDAYFRASVTDHDHPDYLFNLAVSLEHLQQTAAARQHYQAALAAAAHRPAAFSTSIASARIERLERGAP